MVALTTMEIIIRIAVAVGLGTVIGIERTLAGKGAGMRTYAMVSLGASLFVLISQIIVSSSINPVSINPLFLAASVISGIGFIGAGLILFQSNKITGVTTAAGLWVSAGVGMASGFGLFDLSVIATIATLLVFTLMWFIEKLFSKFSYKKDSDIE